MNLENKSDEVLIHEVLAGNEFAYGSLVERYKTYVHTIVYKIVHQPEDSEDVAQEVFIKVFRSLHSFQFSSKFSTWLYRIATNTAISHRRKQKFTTSIDAVNEQSESTYPLKQKEQKYFLSLAMKQLHEDDVVLLTLFYLKELSLKEIAEIVNSNSNTVKVKLHRARKRLAEQMHTLLPNESISLL